MAYDPYPTHTHFLNENDDGKKCKYVSVREALADLPEPDDAEDINQKNTQKQNIWGNIVKDSRR